MAGKIDATRRKLDTNFREPDRPAPILFPDSDIYECMSLDAGRDLECEVVDRVAERDLAQTMSLC